VRVNRLKRKGAPQKKKKKGIFPTRGGSQILITVGGKGGTSGEKPEFNANSRLWTGGGETGRENVEKRIHCEKIRFRNKKKKEAWKAHEGWIVL